MIDRMFGADYFGGLIGLGVALVMGPVHLALQMRSRETRLGWREVLVFSLAIPAATAFVVAVGGIIDGNGGYAVGDAAVMFVPMFLLIVGGSLAGRGAGWVLQRLRDRI